jgi:serpin B
MNSALRSASAMTLLSLPLLAQNPTAEADAAALAAALGRFGAAVMAQQPAGNLCYSPASTALALLMCLGGAGGTTAAELQAALAPAGLDGIRLHAAAAALQQRLRRTAKGFELSCAQDLFVQQGKPLMPPFVELLRKHYGLSPRAVDFRKHVEGARTAINTRIAELTRGRIPELIEAGLLDTATRLVLTNALYLKADWLHPFAAGGTLDAAFHLDGGTAVSVPTMHLDASLEVADGELGTVVRLPYVGGEFAFDVALPNEGGQLDATLRALVATTAGDWRGKLVPTPTELALPRFHIENRMVLNDALEKAGIKAAFSRDADFRGFFGGDEPLYIDLVLQKTWLDVAETGTEAAAATAVVVKCTSVRPEGRTIRFDRPFAYALRDLRTGLCLFAGRCNDPRGAARN